MSFKTILVPIEQHDLMNATLETALVLARKFDSYVEGFALRPVVAPVMAMDIGGAFPLAELQENDTKMATEARALFDAFMNKHSVARSGDPKGTLSCGWFDGAPDGDQFVGSHGRVFDVTVLGRPGESAQSPRLSTYEACLFESGRPILLAPPEPPAKMGENILIAWNHSTEQARTNAFAMPLLAGARKVTVLTVEGGSVVGPAGEQVKRHLAFNGIAADAVTVNPGNRNSGEVILSHAEQLGCDLIIKGAYTQSRLRQMIFGGATRHILAHTKLPVLMSH
jgi:nucleotide-binding universal stress UspA family protein